MSGDRTVPKRILQLESAEIAGCLRDLFMFEFDNHDRRVAYNDFYETTISRHSQTWSAPERKSEE